MPHPVQTRFAPGLTGDLHVGSVANALVNWFHARKHGGRFLLRQDGGGMAPAAWDMRETIIRDLTDLGMEPDGVWMHAAHRADLTAKFRVWIRRELDSFACHCTPQDLALRALGGHSGVRIDRPEKYPPPDFAIEACWANDERGAPIYPAFAGASSEARGDYLFGPKPGSDCRWAARNAIQKSGGAWRPWSCGFQGPWSEPQITFQFGGERVKSITLVFPTGKPRKFALTVISSQGIAETIQVEDRETYVTPENWDKSRCLYEIPTAGREGLAAVHVRLVEAAPQFQRPYYYDGHCARDPANFTPEALEAAMGDMGGVIRLRQRDENDYAGQFPETQLPGDPAGDPFPTAVWFDGAPDLAWYSPWWDCANGITDVLRGDDLRPFARLEAATARRLGYRPRRKYHRLLVDPDGVKFGKTLGSPRALDEGTPKEVIGRAAFLMGLAPDDRPRMPKDLLDLPATVAWKG